MKQSPQEIVESIEKKQQAAIDKMADPMTGNTLGKAVMFILESGQPLSLATLRQHFQDELAARPQSPTASWQQGALTYLDRFSGQ
ncbi:hypothetical protein [Salmonella enterica]|uniref:hypothetical protein n=1 Tax=Salmonella enterica TaxID=28901 RepID=UPI0021D4FA77|nr:hypothetical protein [Salmonella enterica]MCU7097900.1 hypothetical protein [Salmonella enterica]MCU7116305.1 hypothetical protein [Salmonella enterica]MCU7123662.1 hypothetical protein [Salmonella enterica]